LQKEAAEEWDDETVVEDETHTESTRDEFPAIPDMDSGEYFAPAVTEEDEDLQELMAEGQEGEEPTVVVEDEESVFPGADDASIFAEADEDPTYLGTEEEALDLVRRDDLTIAEVVEEVGEDLFAMEDDEEPTIATTEEEEDLFAMDDEEPTIAEQDGDLFGMDGDEEPTKTVGDEEPTMALEDEEPTYPLEDVASWAESPPPRGFDVHTKPIGLDDPGEGGAVLPARDALHETFIPDASLPDISEVSFIDQMDLEEDDEVDLEEIPSEEIMDISLEMVLEEEPAHSMPPLPADARDFCQIEELNRWEPPESGEPEPPKDIWPSLPDQREEATRVKFTASQTERIHQENLEPVDPHGYPPAAPDTPPMQDLGDVGGAAAGLQYHEQSFSYPPESLDSPPAQLPGAVTQAPPLSPQDGLGGRLDRTADLGPDPASLSMPQAAGAAPFKQTAELRPGEALAASSRRRRQTAPIDRTTTSFLELVRGASGHRWVFFALGALGVVAVAICVGFLVRYFLLDEQLDSKRKDAEMMLQQGNFSDFVAAAQSYEEILERRPDDVNALWTLTRVQAAIPFEFGDPNPQAHVDAQSKSAGGPDRHAAAIYAQLYSGSLLKADELLSEVAGKYPKDPLLLYLGARIRLLQGAAGEAKKRLVQACQAQPANALIQSWLGDCLAAQAKHQQALNAFDKALKINKDHVGAILGRTRVLLDRRQDLEGVEQALMSILKGTRSTLSSRGQRGWAHLLLARLKITRGDQKAGKDHIREAQKSRPTRDAVWQDALAVLLIDSYMLAEAEEVIKESRRIMKGWPLPHYRMAQILLLFGRPNAALQELKHTRNLEFPEFNLLKAKLYLAVGRLWDASRAVDEALKAAPHLVAAHIMMAEVLAAQGKTGEASTKMQSLLSEHSKNVQVLTALGNIHLKAGRTHEARQRFVEALAVDRLAIEARIKLVDVSMAEGRYKDALNRLTEARRGSSGNLQVLRRLADLKFSMGNFVQARSDYLGLISRAPNDPRVRIGVSRVFTALHDFGRALTEIKAGEAHHADPAAVALARGRLALARGKAGEAVGYLVSVTKSRPKDPGAWDLLVRAYLMDNDEGGAKSTVDALTNKIPGSPEAMIAAGRVDLHLGNSQRAGRRLSKAIQLLATSPRPPLEKASILILLGRAYHDSGRLSEALARYQEAMNICPECPETHYRKGLALDENGDTQQALSSLRRAIALNPRLTDVYYDLGQVLERAGQNSQAIKAYRSYLSLNPPSEFAEAAREAIRNLR